MTTDNEAAVEQEETKRLSYKFQRLRERLRQAIESGEIAGKLPGERVLAKRFKVNAKTLSKALTDLAAQGLLERSIGLGTFVRGAAATKPGQRCLILHDREDQFADVAASLGCDDIVVHTHDHLLDLPPSLLAPHRAVIVLSNVVSDKTLRELVVRGKIVITVERRVQPYVTHAVLLDRSGDLCDLARTMIRGGHRKLMVVDDHHADTAAEVKAAIAPGIAEVTVGGLNDVAAAIAGGVTGLLCTRAETARRAIEVCNEAGSAVPQRISVAAVGRQPEAAPCTGRFTPSKRIVNAIHDLLRDANPHRPTTLWLRGEAIDAGTLLPRE